MKNMCVFLLFFLLMSCASSPEMSELSTIAIPVSQKDGRALCIIKVIGYRENQELNGIYQLFPLTPGMTIHTDQKPWKIEPDTIETSKRVTIEILPQEYLLSYLEPSSYQELLYEWIISKEDPDDGMYRLINFIDKDVNFHTNSIIIMPFALEFISSSQAQFRLVDLSEKDYEQMAKGVGASPNTPSYDAVYYGTEKIMEGFK